MKAPDRGQKTHFDDALRGFGVRISQGGSKSFVVMYGPKRRLKTLGRYPDISLANARIEAKRVQAETHLEVGIASPRAPTSFPDARSRFLADSKIRNKERTYEDYVRLLCRHFKFEQNLCEVTRQDVMRSIEALAATPSEQQHAFVVIRVMMNWCVKRGLLDVSPIPPLSFKTTARSTILNDVDLRSVWQRSINVGYPYGTITQLLLLTGQRRGEIAGLRRSWIEDDLIVFPEGFAKNRREHRLPLSEKTRDVLATIPDTDDLFFPARGVAERPFNGWGSAKKRFDSEITVTPYTLHDLRRTYSSNLARLGVPIHVTEKLLNHVSGTISGIAAVYNRYSYLEEMRDAVSRHDAFLAKLVEEC